MAADSRIQSIPVAGHQARVRFLEGSRADAPAIIALHGFTGSGEDFLPLREALGERAFHWILPDFMGHGGSQSPPNLDPYLLGNTLSLVDQCRRLAGDRATILLGYSMGGRIALHYLSRAIPLPTVLIGASPGIEDPSERVRRRQSDQAWGDRIRESLTGFCNAWEAQALIHPQTQLPEPLRTQLARRRRQNAPPGLLNSLRALGSGNLPSLWSRLSAFPPVHCLFGEADLKFAGIAENMVQVNPAMACRAIPDAGHAAHLENPEAVAEALLDLPRTA